ncbi:HIRAN domain-containing protein [Nesterenkonia aurantiaca]|uniref:HIRAN domain-containing protein n=1 Tax=Nesterenkonia aurantiaca TaxID=1436010 RepID=UPI003EE4B799
MEFLILTLVVIAVSCWGVSKLMKPPSEAEATAPNRADYEATTERPRESIWLSATEADELLGHLKPGDDLPLSLRWGPGGLLPTTRNRKHLAPGNRHLTRLGLYWLNGRGASHYEAQHKRVNIKVHDLVELQREPKNKHDPNAIAIKRRGSTLGYVNKGLARRLAKRMDAGEEFKAVTLRTKPFSVMIGKPEDLKQLDL